MWAGPIMQSIVMLDSFSFTFPIGTEPRVTSTRHWHPSESTLPRSSLPRRS